MIETECAGLNQSIQMLDFLFQSTNVTTFNDLYNILGILSVQNVWEI